MYNPPVVAFLAISCKRFPMTFSSAESTPSTFIILRRLPSLSVCTTDRKRFQSSVMASMKAVLLRNSPVFDSSLNSESRLPLLNDLRSPSSDAIRFSSFALSNRSVLPESNAMYSEKFMPDFSSIAPSSMVRAPIAPLLSWLMKVCLQCRRLNL